MEANTVFDIAQEYSVNYLDFWTLKKLVDFDTDCYDSNAHLNPSGARKMTTYIGQYIMDHYDIRDQRKNTDYGQWYEAYEQYMQMKNNNIQKQTELKPYLMLLNDKHLSFSVFIPEQSLVLENEILKKLFKNAGTEADKISGILEKTNVLITVDRCGNTVICSGDSEVQNTSFGEIRSLDDENEMVICLDDKEKLRLKDSEEVGIMIFDNENLKIIGTKKFKMQETDFTVVKE